MIKGRGIILYFCLSGLGLFLASCRTVFLDFEISEHEGYAFKSTERSSCYNKQGPVCFLDLNRGIVCRCTDKKTFVLTTVDGGREWVRRDTIPGRCVWVDNDAGTGFTGAFLNSDTYDIYKSDSLCGAFRRYCSIPCRRIQTQLFASKPRHFYYGVIRRLADGSYSTVDRAGVVFYDSLGRYIRMFSLDIPPGSSIAVVDDGVVVCKNLHHGSELYLVSEKKVARMNRKKVDMITAIVGSRSRLLVGDKDRGTFNGSIRNGRLFLRRGGAVRRKYDPVWLEANNGVMYYWGMTHSVLGATSSLYASGDGGRSWRRIVKHWPMQWPAVLGIYSSYLKPCATPEGVILYTPEGKVYTVKRK